jgi:hypothetical protein
MNNWRKQLKFDPLPPLLSSANEALMYLARRDLLAENVDPVQRLWLLPEAQKILKKQQPDGCWARRGAQKHPAINHAFVETWQQFRFLVEQYGFTREHPQARLAAEFLFSCRTQAGDFRGILAHQYATYYTARSWFIDSGGLWRRSADQTRIPTAACDAPLDGGWTFPLLTHKFDRATPYRLTTQPKEPVEPDRSKPFAHNWTGMVLRAFAVYSAYRKSQAARTAADLLKSSFFKPDAYASCQATVRLNPWDGFVHRTADDETGRLCQQ